MTNLISFYKKYLNKYPYLTRMITSGTAFQCFPESILIEIYGEFLNNTNHFRNNSEWSWLYIPKCVREESEIRFVKDRSEFFSWIPDISMVISLVLQIATTNSELLFEESLEYCYLRQGDQEDMLSKTCFEDDYWLFYLFSSHAIDLSFNLQSLIQWVSRFCIKCFWNQGLILTSKLSSSLAIRFFFYTSLCANVSEGNYSNSPFLSKFNYFIYLLLFNYSGKYIRYYLEQLR